MKQNPSTQILDLPTEVLEQVLGHLTYSELNEILPTCRTFCTISLHIMSQSLPRLVADVDVAIAGVLAPHRQQGVLPGILNQRRLYRGVSSLMVLSGLLHTTQACSVHQVIAGEFPPLPEQFLLDARDAVMYASRRNPLVGRSRLAMLHATVGKYFQQCVLTATSLSSLGLFRTVVDVLANLPGAAGTLVHTEAGIQYSKPLPRLDPGWFYLSRLPRLQPTRTTVNLLLSHYCVLFRDPRIESASAKTLLLELVQLGLHVVSEYVRTDQKVQVEFQPSERVHTEVVTAVRLVVGGCEGSTRTLKHLRTSNPSCFSLTFIVEGPFKEFSHTFRDCGND